MIEIQGVSKTFKERDGGAFTAVENVSFAVRKGEFVSILGPSGCGKSTLLNLVAGLEQTETGRIEVLGKTIQGPGTDRIVVFKSIPYFRG